MGGPGTIPAVAALLLLAACSGATERPESPPVSAAGTPTPADPRVTGSPAATLDWPAREARATRVAATRDGTVGFAVIDADGDLVASSNADNRVYAASTIKVMLLLAYLRQAGVADRDLTAAERDLLGPMITRSLDDNATRVRDQVGFGAVDSVARAAGMKDFRQDPRWGLSEISPRDMARLFHRLDRLLPDRHRAYALSLLSGITPSQRWGVPRVTPDHWRWHVKGGWINGVVNQGALLTRGTDTVALAILIEGTPGTEDDVQQRPYSVPGPRTIERVAEALLNGM